MLEGIRLIEKLNITILRVSFPAFQENLAFSNYTTETKRFQTLKIKSEGGQQKLDSIKFKSSGQHFFVTFLRAGCCFVQKPRTWI